MSKLPALLSASLLSGSLLLSLQACVGEPGIGFPPAPVSEVDDVDNDGDDIGNPDPDPLPPLGAPQSGAAFILAHGFGGSADSFAPSIVAALEADGHAVLRSKVPAVDSVVNRATALAAQVDQVIAQTGVPKVHIIAHSQGGLDARYLVASLGYGERVASVTTISTPHLGTPLADLALGAAGEEDEQNIALDLFLSLAGDVNEVALRLALFDLSEQGAFAFNTANPDVAGVYYQSFAGLGTVFGVSVEDAESACKTQPLSVIPDPDVLAAPLVLAAPIVAKVPDTRLAHDGVVSVKSANHATFRGCIPADHLDEVAAPEGTAYDAASFFRGIAAELAAP